MNDFPELVSEKRHINNLLYLRELEKLKLDNWVESKQSGELGLEEDYAMDRVENIALIDQCITNLHSKIRFFDKKRESDLPNYLTQKIKI